MEDTAKADGEPKRGGRVCIALNGASPKDTLNPGHLTDTFPAEVSFGQTRNCLVELDTKHEPVGELAASWSRSKSADVWHFSLRQGVEFHNGKSLSSDDVVYTVQQHMGEQSESAVKSLLKQIKQVRPDGPNAVTFELEAGNVDFPYILSDYHLSIVPEGTSGQDYENGIGTGAYVLKEWEPGVRALTTRNPNYWKAGSAHFAEVETIAVNDVRERTEALKTGRIDIMDHVETASLTELESNPDVRIVRTSEMRHFAISMRVDQAPFDNKDVRLALKFAIDRNAVLREVLGGQGTLGNDTPIGPDNRYYAEDIRQRKYDPDRARWHLSKAGYSQLELDLTYADVAFAGAEETVSLYRENAARAGITIKLQKVSDEDFWHKIWMKNQWRTSYWSGHVSADWMLSAVYAQGSPWNETYWENERFNSRLISARSETNEDLRRQMYTELQQIIHDDGGAVIPAFANHVAAVRKNIAMPSELIPAWGLDGHKAMERWWFK